MTVLLTERVGAVVARVASRSAFVVGAQVTTYGDFWRMTACCAASLRRAGVVPGGRVALCLPNSAAAAAAVYGIWRVGAIAVPLNAQARARDFAGWLRHAEAQVLIAAGGNAEVLEALSGLEQPPVLLDVAQFDVMPFGPPGEEAAAAVDAALHADDTAQILYTSGTTGRPKGVMLSHGNLAANVDSIQAYLQLGQDDSVLSLLPFYYSYGASVLHTHLAVGGRIVLEAGLVYPQVIAETLARERVTGFPGVPATFSLLLARVELARFDLRSLRYVTQAGGPMAPALARRVAAAFPRARLFIMYGQTEATARLSWLPPGQLAYKPGSAGIEVPGVELCICDEQGRPLPLGEEGEVCARGPNVMQGYWRDPEETARALRDGWLHTGDLGRLDADGYLFLSGRRSDMIKTGAHRVHPADVEEAIAELPGVAEVAVVGVDDEVLGQAIRACVVLQPGNVLTEMMVKAHCRQRLAPYKVPKQVEFRDGLPRTASGKVQRYELETVHP